MSYEEAQTQVDGPSYEILVDASLVTGSLTGLEGMQNIQNVQYFEPMSDTGNENTNIVFLTTVPSIDGSVPVSAVDGNISVSSIGVPNSEIHLVAQTVDSACESGGYDDKKGNVIYLRNLEQVCKETSSVPPEEEKPKPSKKQKVQVKREKKTEVKDGRVKRKRFVLSLEQKMHVIQRNLNGESYKQLANAYGVGKSTICEIVQAKDRIMRYTDEVCGEQATKRKTMRKATYDKLDDALYLWFCQQQDKGVHVNGSMLAEKATELNINIKCDGDNMKNFKASGGFIARFKKRHGIQQTGEKDSRRLTTEQVGSVNLRAKINNEMEKSEMSNQQIYTIGETLLFWKTLPTDDLEPTEINEKCFVMVCTNFSGDHKLKPLVIGKHKRPKSLRSVIMNNLPVEYYSDPKLWLTEPIFADWFQHTFIPSVTEYASDNNLSGEALLLIDSTYPNQNGYASPCGKIRTMFFTKSTKMKSKPMNCGILDLMHQCFKWNLMSTVLTNIDFDTNTDDDVFKAIIESRHSISFRDALIMLAEAWSTVLPSAIVRAWEKTIFNNSSVIPDLDRSPEVDAMIGEINELALLLPAEPSEDAIKAWCALERTATQMHLKNEVIGSNEQAPADTDTDVTSSINITTAIKSGDTLLRWLETQADIDVEKLAQLKQIMTSVRAKKLNTIRQQEIINQGLIDL